jgi:tetratricopeptide (TPR) repeat protein
MPHKYLDVAALEELREIGDYDKLAAMLPLDWQTAAEFEEEAVQLRVLTAEIAGRTGRLEEMEMALSPYLTDIGRVPFSLAARVLLTVAVYHYRRNEPSEAIRLASQAHAIAGAREDDFTVAEAVQLEGQALWSLEKWEEASRQFEEAISLYAAQLRPYRLGLAYLCMGAVLNRMGRVEDARTALERAIKVLLKSHDEYNLAIARVNVALPLNYIGEYETALKYLLFANEKFEQMGHDQYAYLTLNNIAATLVWLKDYDRAESYVMRALEKGIAVRSTQIGSTYEIKARVHICRREWEGAEKALIAALDIAEQANSQLQKAEVRRTLGRLFLAQERDTEAASALWQALDLAQDLRSSLLEIEVKSLLAQSICKTHPVEACNLLSDIDAALGDRHLPDLRKEAQIARRRINALDQEHYFILSDAHIPLLADAKISLLKWLWARALYKARGNARDAANILGVTPTYIRKLTKVIPRDLLRPGKKRPKKK